MRASRLDARCGSDYNAGVKRRWFWPALVLLLAAALVGGWRYYTWREHSQDPVILAAARHYGIEPALVKAVVWRESWFDPRARGKAGEIGLMQIRELTANDWAKAERRDRPSPAHLADPGTNALVGAWYLSRLVQRYEQTDRPLVYALADYNAGRSNVLRWRRGGAETNSDVFLGHISYPGTRRYVESVLGRYRRYLPEFSSQP